MLGELGTKNNRLSSYSRHVAKKSLCTDEMKEDCEDFVRNPHPSLTRRLAEVHQYPADTRQSLKRPLRFGCEARLEALRYGYAILPS